MKIIIHSMAELLELAELVTFGKEPREVQFNSRAEPMLITGSMTMSNEAAVAAGLLQAEPDGLPPDIPAPLAASMDAAVAETSAALRQADEPGNDDLPGIDADGAPHNTDWHSDPAKLTAKGLWRARRGRDEGAYKAWLLSLAVDIAEAAVAADAEPVATETHALPSQFSDEDPICTVVAPQEAGSEPPAEPVQPASTVDLQALVAAAFDQAASQSTDVRELLNAAQAFTTAHGHAKFNELKSAVAPIDGNPFGKTLQLFTPEERQLMMACLANYPSN